ncbi:MAG TPA: hypothetical protein VMK66_19050 [Myxococcales bacterium]|nr:hypothetical protein [Myxococcales bacterium]
MLLALLVAATVRGPADVESLTAAADAVVYARVTRQSSSWGRGGGQIFTTVALRPIETWKGAAEAAISVLVAGGEVGELSQSVPGEAAFSEGEEVVLFLHRRAPGLFAVERMALGKFSVAQGKALRDRRFVSCLGCAAGEADELSLDELRARVLGSARK